MISSVSLYTPDETPSFFFHFFSYFIASVENRHKFPSNAEALSSNDVRPGGSINILSHCYLLGVQMVECFFQLELVDMQFNFSTHTYVVVINEKQFSFCVSF